MDTSKQPLLQSAKMVHAGRFFSLLYFCLQVEQGRRRGPALDLGKVNVTEGETGQGLVQGTGRVGQRKYDGRFGGNFFLPPLLLT